MKVCLRKTHRQSHAGIQDALARPGLCQRHHALLEMGCGLDAVLRDQAGDVALWCFRLIDVIESRNIPQDMITDIIISFTL